MENASEITPLLNNMSRRIQICLLQTPFGVKMLKHVSEQEERDPLDGVSSNERDVLSLVGFNFHRQFM